MARTITVEAGWANPAGDRVQEVMVRMTCGHLARRMMKPSTAASLPHNEAGEPLAPYAKCPYCDGLILSFEGR